MAIPKKGSRTITVNGVRYLWRIRHKPTYEQGRGLAYLSVAVEKAENPGTTLVVSFPQKHPSSWVIEEKIAVLPSNVKDCIEKALTLGWQPSNPGGAFEFTYFPN